MQSVMSKLGGWAASGLATRSSHLKKKMGHLRRRGCCHPPPRQHAGLPSELGRVRDFQKIKRINKSESWAAGHRVCLKTCFAASSSLHVMSATTWTNPHHNPSAVDAALIAPEKRSLPHRDHPSIPLCSSCPQIHIFKLGSSRSSALKNSHCLTAPDP